MPNEFRLKINSFGGYFFGGLTCPQAKTLSFILFSSKMRTIVCIRFMPSFTLWVRFGPCRESVVDYLVQLTKSYIVWKRDINCTGTIITLILFHLFVRIIIVLNWTRKIQQSLAQDLATWHGGQFNTHLLQVLKIYSN